MGFFGLGFGFLGIGFAFLGLGFGAWGWGGVGIYMGPHSVPFCRASGKFWNHKFEGFWSLGIWEFESSLARALCFGVHVFWRYLGRFFLKYPTMWLARVLGRAVSAWGLHSYSRLVRLDSQLKDFRSLENKVAPTLNPKP